MQHTNEKQNMPLVTRYYGLYGLALIITMLIIAARRVSCINLWVTPLGWCGYIVFVDWLVYRRTRRSLLCNRPKEFWTMFVLSIGLWCIFEVHNLLFQNWEYIGIPPHFFVIVTGMVLSFGTILPAMYETYEFLRTFPFLTVRVTPHSFSKPTLYAEMIVGVIVVFITVIFPSYYTGPLVWLGYFFVFVPLNYLIGSQSILKEREEGHVSDMLNLLAAGYICGVVWEFFNYWAGAKWVYHVPFLEHIKVFEMPILGFLAFGPFAVLFVEMYRVMCVLMHRGKR